MENAPVIYRPTDSLFSNVDRFELAQRVAKGLQSADMVPDHFRGNLGNILIAINYAQRTGMDEFMAMQCMYVIHGKPGIEGKLVAALVNQSGKYKTPLRYRWVDADDNEVKKAVVVNNQKRDFRGCLAYTTAQDGKEIEGPKISWEIVYAEGWYGKGGTKWKTMPEIMFMYRAASWFANVHCPEVKLGMQTVEELRDFVDVTPTASGDYAVDKKVADLESAVKPEPKKEPEQTPEPEPERTESDEDYEIKMLRESDRYKSYDPFNEPLMKKYVNYKLFRLRDILDQKEVKWTDNMTGKELHQRLLHVYNKELTAVGSRYRAKGRRKSLRVSPSTLPGRKRKTRKRGLPSNRSGPGAG